MNLSIHLKEYGNSSNDGKVIFNSLLRGARNPSECAFGRLKNRWAILIKRIDIKLQNIPKAIYTCFILHNYCEARDGTFNFGEIKTQVAEVSNNTARNNGPNKNIQQT